MGVADLKRVHGLFELFTGHDRIAFGLQRAGDIGAGAALAQKTTGVGNKGWRGGGMDTPALPGPICDRRTAHRG